MIKTLGNFNFRNKRVLVRVDYQVPFSKNGKILDDFRIKSSIPTIEYLKKKNAKVILMSHWKAEDKGEGHSLKPISRKLEKLLKQKIKFLNDCIGEKVEKEIAEMRAGEIVLLENLRFYKEEGMNDNNFAKSLAKLGDIFINDAFSVCHRSHASVVGIPKYLPSGAGLLLEKEIEILSQILEKPKHPLVVIIGGAKIETKIKMIERFLKKTDHLLLAGVIANSILINKGFLHKNHSVSLEIKKIVDKINIGSPKIHLPVDGIVSLINFDDKKQNYQKILALDKISSKESIYDIGPETIKIFSQIIKSAKMIFWNGPMGMFEDKRFENGTKIISQEIIKNKSAFKIAGGGDIISALNKFKLANKFDHICTAGGAMLEFLSGEELPGIKALF